MADKFPFFESYYESLRELPPEQFKDVVTAMCEKAFHDNDVTLNGTAKGFYTLIKPIIEKSLELSERRSSTGRLGGRPTKPNRNQTETKPKPNENQTETKSKANDNQTISKPKADKDKDKEEDKDIKEKQEKEKVAVAPRFRKPTVAEVSEYCRERNNGISPESFIDFYESKGWKVGSQPMKDWKACVRTWEQRRKTESRAAPRKNSFCNFEQKYTGDLSELERQLLEN